GPERAGHRSGVEEEIVVHQIALVRVAGPDPTVAFDPIYKEFPGIEMEGIGGDIPDGIDLRIGAAEAALCNDRCVFEEQGGGVELKVAGHLNVDIAQRAGAFEGRVDAGGGVYLKPVEDLATVGGE